MALPGNARRHRRRYVAEPDDAITINSDEVWVTCGDICGVVIHCFADWNCFDDSEIATLKKNGVEAFNE